MRNDSNDSVNYVFFLLSSPQVTSQKINPCSRSQAVVWTIKDNWVLIKTFRCFFGLPGRLLPHMSAVSQHRGGRGAGVLVTQARRLPACPGARLQSPGVVYQPSRGSGCWRGQKVISPRLNYASQAVMRLSRGDGWRTGIFAVKGPLLEYHPGTPSARLLRQIKTC